MVRLKDISTAGVCRRCVNMFVIIYYVLYRVMVKYKWISILSGSQTEFLKQSQTCIIQPGREEKHHGTIPVSKFIQL